MFVPIPNDLRTRVRVLISCGESHSAISRQLRLSRNTVARIASQISATSTPREGHPPGYDERNKRRCQSCGHMVYLWPCLACELGEKNQTLARKQPPTAEGKSIAAKLTKVVTSRWIIPNNLFINT